MSLKILIAPDSFKESLTAQQVAGFLKEGIETALPKVSVVMAPVTDGGEGFLDAMVNGSEELYKNGFSLLLSILSEPMSLAEALQNAPGLVKETDFRIGKILKFNTPSV